MSLKEAFRKGEFVVSCEFVPGRGKSGPAIDAAAAFARDSKASGMGVHAVSLTDNPGGNPAILPDVVASEIQNEGMDALVHFSCRDFNRNAIESRAMALARQGIHNLLVVTGDYTESGHQGNAAPVFDMGSVQAIQYLRAMSNGLEVPGRKRGTTETLSPTEFLIGAAVSPFKMTEQELLPQFFKLEKKIAAGADFVVPQLGYDMRKFFEIKRYMAARGLDVPVLGNVYVLSYGVAKAMAANRIPGCVVSEELVATLKEEAATEDKGKAARFERAAKMIAVFKGMGFSGVHIGGFNLKTQDFATILNRARELESGWEGFLPELCFGRKGEYYAFPEPKRYIIETPDADPVAAVERCSKPFAYGFSLMMHAIMFEPKSVIYKLMVGYFKRIKEKGLLYKLTHRFESIVKRLIFDCRDCGDCALGDLAYCCPMSGCAKKQRNGACGGSLNGWCEVYPEEKLCVWTRVYKRLKSSGALGDMREAYVPARKAELEDTSGWANFYLGRDHNKQPVQSGAGKQQE